MAYILAAVLEEKGSAGALGKGPGEGGQDVLLRAGGAREFYMVGGGENKSVKGSTGLWQQRKEKEEEEDDASLLRSF